jgi:hypothetical protein
MERLPLTAEEFRALADRVVDLAAGLLAGLPTARAFPETSGAETQAAFDAPFPEDGLGPVALDALARVIALSRPPGPRFFGYVLGSGEPVAALGDLLAGVLNQNVTAWRSSPAAVTIERVVVRWLAEAIGCPGFVGSLTGGGSSANLMGLAMAREARAPANTDGVVPGGVVYASSEVHMSIPRAAALLGLGHAGVRSIRVDGSFRMDVAALERAVEEDVAAGRRPIAVVATAGTVSTGAIDPLRPIAEVAARHGLWMHVDGAYGALAALAIPEAFEGMELADSISLDAHKWLYQPLDCGCLLYRGRRRGAAGVLAHRGLHPVAARGPGGALRLLRGVAGAVAALPRHQAVALASATTACAHTGSRSGPTSPSRSGSRGGRRAAELERLAPSRSARSASVTAATAGGPTRSWTGSTRTSCSGWFAGAGSSSPTPRARPLRAPGVPREPPQHGGGCRRGRGGGARRGPPA